MEKNYEPVRFLIVEDDDISVMAIRRAMTKLKIANPTQVAKDGREALDLLRAAVDIDNKLPPYVVTLDLSMPRMNGLEFLDEVRRDPVLQPVVVFVLTTSDTPSDIASAYEKNIAGYIVKEDPIESFNQSLKLLNQYSQLVVLPT